MPDLTHIFDVETRRLTESILDAAETGVAGAEDSAGDDAPEPAFIGGAGRVRLYHGDALQILRHARPESFDLIFADPPYFLSGGGMTCHAGKRVSVNKGAWDTPTTFAAMHEFNLEWLGLCRRLLKPNGTLWVSGTLHNMPSVGYALQTLGYKVLNDIAWHKVNPPPNLSCRYFTHSHETLLWARKDAKARHTFHYDEMRRENGGKQMQSLWRIPPPRMWEKRYGKHPTQKPEALLDRIIRASCSPGDWVLDPFFGSGTTGVICARLGRKFVGVEQEEDFVRLAKRRLTDELTRPGDRETAPLRLARLRETRRAYRPKQPRIRPVEKITIDQR